MRLHLIHSDKFAWTATRIGRFSEPQSDSAPGKYEAANALVVYVSPEKPDEERPDVVAEKAGEAILDMFARTKCAKIVLVPHMHLASNPATEAASLDIIKRVQSKLRGKPSVRCPFGWFKDYSIRCRETPAGQASVHVQSEIALHEEKPKPRERIVEQPRLSDLQISKMLRPMRTPKSDVLRAAIPQMSHNAVAHREDPGPAREIIFNGEVADNFMTVTLYNWDEGKPLMSLAALNEIAVCGGNIYGLPSQAGAMGDRYEEVYSSGVWTGLRYIDLILNGFTASAESLMTRGKMVPLEMVWKIVKKPQEIFLLVPDEARGYMTARHKTIRVGGPLFFGLRAEWKPLRPGQRPAGI